MKKKGIILGAAVVLLVLVAWVAGIWLDSYHFAPNHWAVKVEGVPVKFYNGSEVENTASNPSFGPYEVQNVFTPDTYYYLVKIHRVREAELDDSFLDERGQKQESSIRYTLAEGEITQVFHDGLGLQEGDRVTLVSQTTSQSSSLYRPMLQEGYSYYTSLYEISCGEHAKPYRYALKTLADYFVEDFCYGISTLRPDGKVEYYFKMMEGGAIREEANMNAHEIVWAELPRGEFEVGFQRLIDDYCKGKGES